MHVHSEGITAALSETKGYLDKLHQEITKTLEKICSREKYINTQVLYLCPRVGLVVSSLLYGS